MVATLVCSSYSHDSWIGSGILHSCSAWAVANPCNDDDICSFCSRNRLSNTGQIIDLSLSYAQDARAVVDGPVDCANSEAIHPATRYRSRLLHDTLNPGYPQPPSQPTDAVPATVRRPAACHAVDMARLWLAQDAPADEMLERDPLALLTAMLLDQQVPLEKAFVGPYRLAERLGVDRLDAAAIADHDPEDFSKIFATPPAIHRFPGAMAERTRKLCRAVADDYAGDAATVWTGARDGKDLLKRLSALPGFGKQKAQIFTALLGKQFDVQLDGWREAAGAYGEAGSFRSVADVTDAQTLAKVREFKKAMKAEARGRAG
jgi:uncharacterized HhH-GPD family protein